MKRLRIYKVGLDYTDWVTGQSLTHRGKDGIVAFKGRARLLPSRNRLLRQPFELPIRVFFVG